MLIFSHPLWRYSVRLLVWLPVALCLWWYALVPVLGPSLQFITDQMVKVLFAREKMHITADPEGNWVVHTILRRQHQQRDYVWVIRVAPRKNTLGFPLLWALLLAVPVAVHRRLGYVVIASLLLAPIAAVTLCTEIFLLMDNLISTGKAQEIIIGPRVYIPLKPFSRDLIAVVHWLYSVLMALTVVIAPVGLWYGLNRPFLRVAVVVGLIKV